MRNILYFAIIAVVMLSCKGESNTEKISGIEIDSICTDSVLSLTSSTNSPKCEVSLNIIFIKGKNSEKINSTLLRSGILLPDYLSLTDEKLSVKQSVDSFVNRYISDYKREYGELYKNDKEHGASYNCSFKLNTDAKSYIDGIIGYFAHITTFGGGIHETKQTIVKNIDINSGKILTINDVFVPGYEEDLNEIILKEIEKKFDAKNIAELQKKYILSDGKPYVTDNFLLTDDKIIFIYCENEIAPHDIGEIRIKIEKSDISNLLKGLH